MKAAMVATRKTTRGFIVTICNYDKYQTPGNYKRTANATTAAERTPQCAATINNNNKHKDIQAERERALSKFQRPSADSAPLRTGKSGMTIESPKQKRGGASRPKDNFIIPPNYQNRNAAAQTKKTEARRREPPER